MTAVMEDVEMCEEDHFVYPVPKSSCNICNRRNSPTRPYNTDTKETRVLIPVATTPTATPFMWTPYSQRIGMIPVGCTFVHITGSFSIKHIRMLKERLPDLVLVEVVNSFAHVVENHLQAFQDLGIGITVRCRYK